MKKLYVLLLILFSATATIGASTNRKDNSIASDSNAEYSIEELKDATKRVHERDSKEYKREQEDIAKRLNSLSKRLIEMHDKLVVMEVTQCDNETCSAIVTTDGIAIENHKDLWRFRYYIKDNEFQTIKLWFKYDFVNDFNKLEESLNKNTVTYMKDSFKKYNLKGELK